MNFYAYPLRSGDCTECYRNTRYQPGQPPNTIWLSVCSVLHNLVLNMALTSSGAVMEYRALKLLYYAVGSPVGSPVGHSYSS
jgi:hypothetical protein